MKTAVLNFMKCSPNSIVASNRIATYISMLLGCELIDNKDAIFETKYDRLFVVNGPLAFCDFREQVQELCVNAKELIWVGNDYAIKMPKYIKDREHWVFSAYENKYGFKNHALVNWNQLTFYKNMKISNGGIAGLTYYGAYRDDREVYFQRYLASKKYPVNVSTSARAKPSFEKINPQIQFWNGKDLVPALSKFDTTIYIEDVTSHKVYCSPANRFYESLSAGIGVLFDVNTEHTFDQAGIDVKKWIVRDDMDVKGFLKKDPKDLRKAQSVLREVDYQKKLKDEFTAALTLLR